MMTDKRASAVGVLGSGAVGRRLAAAFSARGHDVKIGSRDPAKEDLVIWLKGDGADIRAGTFAEAADHGEIVVMAVLGTAVEEAVRVAGSSRFSGKVVIDTTNPLDFSHGFPPVLAWANTDSGGEHLQRAIPEARVVKALNIVGNPLMVDPVFSDGAPTMFIAGDDDEAKKIVGGLLTELGWLSQFDLGGIKESRLLESLCVLWVTIASKRKASDHALRLLVG